MIEYNYVVLVMFLDLETCLVPTKLTLSLNKEILSKSSRLRFFRSCGGFSRAMYKTIKSPSIMTMYWFNVSINLLIKSMIKRLSVLEIRWSALQSLLKKKKRQSPAVKTNEFTGALD